MRARAAVMISGVAALCAGGLALAQTAKPAPTAAKPPAAVAATPAKPLGPHAALSTKEVMKYIVNPAAETYWAHTGVVDDDKGSNDRTPTSQAEWDISITSAAQLAEAGNLLMMEGRARDPNGPWMKYAQALTDAGLAGMAAATAKNHDKTFDAGGVIYNACFNCHGRYIQRPKDSLYKHDIDKDLEAAGKAKAPQ
jgi:hypothetical protein